VGAEALKNSYTERAFGTNFAHFYQGFYTPKVYNDLRVVKPVPRKGSHVGSEEIRDDDSDLSIVR
jgi:hypothetical protein